MWTSTLTALMVVMVVVLAQAVKSDLKSLNIVLPSGLVSGIPINFLGRYMSGKTLLALQQSYYICTKFGGSILFLDVDGGGTVFLSEWQPTLQKRYGNVKVECLAAYNVQRFDPRQKLPYFDLQIYQLFGVKSQVNMSGKGKANFTAYSPLESVIRKKLASGARCVIVDSFSQVFKDLFVGTESFGERARAEDFLFGLLRAHMLEYPDSFWFLNHHNSVNPMSGEVRISGGSSVLHNSKVAVYINKPSDRAAEGELWTYRYPNIAPFGRSAKIVYTEAGIIDG
ncbi:MAG: hypothetical protein QXO47_10640 [Thermoproteota archaeon]